MAALLWREHRAFLAVAAVGVVATVGVVAAPQAYAVGWHFQLGIGEQDTAMFSDPRFAALGLRHVRLVVPYDVACRRGSAEGYVDAWLAAAERAGARPLVAFSSSWQLPRWRLPSYRTYLRCFRAFRARWPRVVDFNPWNEVNHWYQPTYRHPRRGPASTTRRGVCVADATSRPAICSTPPTSPAGSLGTAAICAAGRDCGRSTTTST
jgi:hypothetical protein